MKVLSLIQPWASLWVAGIKRIETRSWGTAYRGKVAVHASKKFNRDIWFVEPFRSALEEIGIGSPEKLPTGALLGWVEVVDVRRMIDDEHDGLLPGMSLGAGICLCCDPLLTERERALGLYAPGRKAWITGDQRLVAAEPIPYPGSQGLRDLPGAVADLLVASR